MCIFVSDAFLLFIVWIVTKVHLMEMCQFCTFQEYDWCIYKVWQSKLLNNTLQLIPRVHGSTLNPNILLIMDELKKVRARNSFKRSRRTNNNDAKPVKLEDVPIEEDEEVQVQDPEVDQDLESDMETSAEELKQEMIEAIVKETGFEEDEVKLEYDKFEEKYPGMEVSKSVFLEANKEFLLAESFFNVFDFNKSNSLNFYEFMQVKKAMELTETEDKLEWIFKIFDLDGAGYIDVLELQDVIEGVYRMVGKPVDKDEVMDCIAEIRYAIDDDRDWKITKEEFVTNGLKSKFILQLLDTKA